MYRNCSKLGANVDNDLKKCTFFRHGKTIAQKPWLFATICVLVCGFFSAGLIQYTPETNPYKLWIPSNSDFVRNTDWLWTKYPPDTR